MEPGLKLPPEGLRSTPPTRAQPPSKRPGGWFSWRLLVAALALVALGVGVAFVWVNRSGAPHTTTASTTPSTTASTNAGSHNATTDSTPVGSTVATTTATQNPGTIGTPVNQEPTPTVLTSLRPNSWLVLLASLSQSDYTAAQALAQAADLDGGSGSVAVVDSSKIPGLAPGYWAIAQVGFTSKAEAAAGCAAVGRPVGDTCIVRQVG